MNRKSTFLIVWLLTLFIIQNKAHSQVKLGIKYGYNAPLMRGSMGWSQGIFDLRYPESLLTGHVGLAVHIPITKVISIQPEALYSNSGYSYYDANLMGNLLNQSNGDLDWLKNELTKNDADWSEALTFLSVPLLFKVRLKGFGVYIGPQFDYLLKTRLISFNRSTAQNDKVSHNYTYKMGMHYSATVGIDYTMRFGLGFNVRYQRGLSRLEKVTYGGFYHADNQLRNDVAMIGMHYFIGKSEKR